MLVRVLGSAAGGGFPQWNCGCANCREVRSGSPRVRSRTQDSLAVSSDAQTWALINASPDIARQIEAFPALSPRAPRHSPIVAIALTNGDLDHCLGLFSLRESWPLVVYATDAVRAGLTERNAIFRTLQRFDGHVTFRRLELGREMDLAAGLTIEARPVKGKLPVHLEGVATPSPEDNVALFLRERAVGKLAIYAAAAASFESIAPSFAAADCLFVDGTFWSSDELPRLGASTSRAEDMAHLPIHGHGGSLARLRGTSTCRKIYTHINNTNPILVEDSKERYAIEREGWEVAFDGMEIDV